MDSENIFLFNFVMTQNDPEGLLCLKPRAREILKSESVQPMTMTSSMSPFPKKNMYISPVTKTNDNWQSYNSF